MNILLIYISFDKKLILRIFNKRFYQKPLFF